MPVRLITCLGEDSAGDLARGHLAANGVAASVWEVPRTSTARVSLSGGEPAYDLDIDWTLPPVALGPGQALHVGSLAALVEPGAAAVRDLAAQARASGRFLSYDPNLRRGWLPEQEPPGRPGAVRALAAEADVVKLSGQDARLLDPSSTPEETARSLVFGRTRLVALTRGAGPVTGYTRSGEITIDASPADQPADSATDNPADTVGAGDAFMAGLLAALVSAGGIPEDLPGIAAALGAAAEVAALSCRLPGGGGPHRGDLRPGWPAPPG